jgi:hypothetical protein
VVNDSGEIDSEIEEVWRAFNALSERKQLKIMLRACQLRGWALGMGRARRVPAVDEDSAVALSPEAAPPTDAAAADSQTEQQDDAAHLSAEDLQDAGAGQEPELTGNLPPRLSQRPTPPRWRRSSRRKTSRMLAPRICWMPMMMFPKLPTRRSE